MSVFPSFPFLILPFFICPDVRHAEDELFHHPVNVAVVTGQRFKFNCIPDSSDSSTVFRSIGFLKYDHNSSARIQPKHVYIKSSGFLIADYTVNLLNAKNGVELGLIDTAKQFAGTYTCVYGNGYNIAAAELVVLGKLVH